jgi:cyclic beta-1,2-glucan synthetase
MESLERHLIRPRDGLALLFTPPFDETVLDPGYIRGYPPGLRENGGQYTHAAMWAVLALAKLGMADKAVALLAMLNPINHARTQDEVARYKVEPYVVAADVYSVPPHAGRGGWTWYTGAAGWFYRAILEYVLGLRFSADTLRIVPCVPPGWNDFEVSIRLPGIDYTVQMRRGGPGEAALLFDGAPVAGDALPLIRDGQRHSILLVIE